MSANDPIWLTETDVVELMHLGEAIDALGAGLGLEANGTANNMVKTHAVWGGGRTLHAIGATVEGAGFVGTKTWAHTAAGATPLLILWDSETGRLRAVIEAFALGQMRTGSMTGLATRWLARPDTDELAQVGTGKQAMAQVAGVAAVRPLKRVRIYSPTPEKRAAFAETLAAKGFDFEVSVADSVAACVEGAPIVTLVTRARAPFLTASMVARGAHVNAVGAITPEREEFAQDLFPRVDLAAADSVPAVQRLSKEFMTYYDGGPGEWTAVRPLSALIAAGECRPANADLTLFKAMGMGISDLSLGMALYERARATGRGRPFPHPERAEPRLRASDRMTAEKGHSS
ncbi:MAG: ornithine cyclodeaminase family protein [Kiloniellaceae bacterium]